MPDFIYPTNVALQQVAQALLPRLEAARPVFNFFPIRNVNAHILEWEQADNYSGLQQVRGLNGDPGRVKPLGARRFLMEPGVYGEFGTIDERTLTTRRPWGQFSGQIDISDLVLEKQNHLLGRRLDRIEQICWTLLTTGTFSVAQMNTVMHTDSYTFQTYTAGVTWATSATAVPLGDLRAVQLKSRGFSVNFGPSAQLYMNRTTFNQILANTNPADLFGKRVTGLQTVNGPMQLNEVLTADDLPNIVIYDEGYISDLNVFTLFIPNNKAVLVGARRDGDPVGEYRMTLNANNPDMGPGAYMKTVDDPNRVPRSIEVHDGHNGGPVMFHPAAIVIMTV